MASPVEATGAARLRVMCSHGGRFLPCGLDGRSRYVGGETRVLVVPRDVSFRELAAKLGEMAGGGKVVSVVRYRLVVDDDDVLVSVTCDEELAHMRDEHDRLRATRPSAIFRVFFPGVQRHAASGRPPLAPQMRRVRSEQAVAASARGMHSCAAGSPPMRRVQSAPAACASKNAQDARQPGQEPAPEVPAAETTGQVIFTDAATSKNSHGAVPEGQEPSAAVDRRAFWEFE